MRFTACGSSLAYLDKLQVILLTIICALSLFQHSTKVGSSLGGLGYVRCVEFVLALIDAEIRERDGTSRREFIDI